MVEEEKVKAAAAAPADAPPSPAVRNVDLKAKLLLWLIAVLLVGFLGYVMFARGVFEPTQRLVLIVDNAEGLTVGTDLTYSGFAIGRVARIELAENGQARVTVAVPRDQAHWLRSTSVFTLERGLVGAARLRAFTGDPKAPPLTEGAERPLLRGDANEEIPVILNNVKAIVQNLQRMTEADSDINESIANLRAVTERMSGQHGVLGAVLGEDKNARAVLETVARANRLLDSLNGLSAKLSGTLENADQAIRRAEQMLAKADTRVLGTGGVVDEAQKTVTELNAAIADARGSLKKIDTVLADAQKVAANAAQATQDLGSLRAEVESNLRRIGSLITEINRKWPFARETEVKLP